MQHLALKSTLSSFVIYLLLVKDRDTNTKAKGNLTTDIGIYKGQHQGQRLLSSADSRVEDNSNTQEQEVKAKDQTLGQKID